MSRFPIVPRTRLLGLLVLLAAVGGFTRLAACWAAPEPVVWIEVAEQDLWLKRDNVAGLISLHPGSQEAEPSWSVQLADFSGLFSQVHLSPDGKHLVHVRGNHQVGRLEDTAIAIHTQGSDAATRLPASSFVDALVEPEGPQVSTAPGSRWLRSCQLGSDAIAVETATGRHLTVVLATGAITAPVQ